ncbi:unnamed protein product [Nezara viridula]|uniref:Clathrin light chain n=1 Tax=Nezara viridula TaxID=85310 RepID=A0A9P0EFV2_NEZVI|nr:unnamed protein product [Nezara viridula]
MDSFGDNFDENEVDPAAEFLAREQSELAALDDELKQVVAPPVNGTDPDMSEITGSFEMINGLGQPDRFDLPQTNDVRNLSPTPMKQAPREEPEKIKKWREQQKLLLEEKDKNEEIKKEEWRAAAKKELEEWYKHHEELITKTKSANRNAEKQFVADTGAIEPGTEWERIAKLCDFNPKSSRTSKDVSRMRSIILQLKQTPLNTTKNT